MKRCILLLALISGFQLTLMAQKTKTNQNAPKENIHVNREYDENGNLTKFDSVYSYSWSGDTTLLDSIHPKNFPDFFGNNFNFSPDSSFFDHSFFDNFDQLFFDPFSKKQDSILNHLGFNKHSQNFHFKNDSLSSNSMNIDDFFRQFDENKNDSISSKSSTQKKPKSMEDLMEMFQKQIKEMEEQQQKLFKK